MKCLNLKSVEPKTLGNSQKGQDSLVKYVFDTIGTTDKYYVEFGAVDGYTSCNTRYLKTVEGWDGLLLDNMHSNPALNLHKYHLTKENICDIFSKHKVPQNFDFLCVDVDGNDYWLLSEILTKYSPRVIMVETNVRFKPYESMVLKYNSSWEWNGWDWYGASPYAFKKLCDAHNYTPVHLHLDDLIIVRNDALCSEDLQKSWLDVYPHGNPSLYDTHIQPGHGPLKQLDETKWQAI